jgi:hypothetical protein
MGRDLIELSAERAETLAIIERNFRGNVDGGFGRVPLATAGTAASGGQGL